MKHAVITRYFAIQIKVIITFLIIFETHMNILFNLKVKILMLIEVV